VVTALDPLRKLDFLSRSEKRNLSDVLEEELQRVCRDLRVGLDLGLRRVVGRDADSSSSSSSTSATSSASRLPVR